MINRKIEKVAIIGMGALGILYGDLLIQGLPAGAVTFLVDEGRKRRYQKEGAFCNGRQCGFQFQDVPKPGEKAGLIIFAVKALTLMEAIDMARPYVGEETAILSLLNGISSEEIIGRELGMDHILYCVAQGMDAVRDGNSAAYTNKGTLCIGIMGTDPAMQKKLHMVADLFGNTGIPYTVEEDIRHRLWSKWMLNVGVNQVVMVYEGTYGTVQKPGKARDLMVAAMEEVILIAGKEGIAVGRQDLEAYVALIDTLNPSGMPSMRQDGLAKRLSEVELFSGTVIRKAGQHGLQVPVNETLYRTIRRMEETYA